MRRPSRPWIALSATLASACNRFWTVPPQDELTRLHGGAPAEALDAASMRVLVWNVYKGKRRQWRSEFERLMGQSDLVLAQELLFHPPTQELLEASELSWTTATSFIYARRQAHATGLGTAARADALEVIALQSEAREPITRTPKLALVTAHRLSDDSTLLVVNVHAINFAGFDPFDAQLEAVEKQIRAHEGPVLLAGDFNTWSGRRRARLSRLRDELELDAVRFELDPRRAPLDHAFVRGLVVEHSKVHRGRASDHMALSFELMRP
jgi:endonuclease/exonuclease/phosphatase (EEP) superfamily protein YafD